MKSSVGCAIAPEPDDDSANELCEKILRFGTFFANNLDSELFAIRAWTVFGEQVLRSRGRMSKQQMNEHIESIRKPTRQIFDKIIAKFRNQAKNTIHTEFHKGSPAHIIYVTAVKRELGLLIIGNVARSGLKAYVIGNTAEEIIQSASCSVLVIKPDEFKAFKSYVDG